MFSPKSFFTKNSHNLTPFLMANFTQSANCVTSPALTSLYPPNPSTSRGNHIVIDAHPKLPLLLYASRTSICVLDTEANRSFVYKGHQANATVARFSPNGRFVASGDSSGKLRVWENVKPRRRASQCPKIHTVFCDKHLP